MISGKTEEDERLEEKRLREKEREGQKEKIISQEALIELKSIFDVFDTDNRGKLSREQFISRLKPTYHINEIHQMLSS